MKRMGIAAASIAVGALFLAAALAAPLLTPSGSGNNVGPHAYKVNIIGRPNEWRGDETSAGKVIFIGIQTVEPGANICEEESGVVDDTVPTPSAEVVPRQRIHFVPGETFEVLDRDATDGSASIQIPPTTGVGGYDVYVRILGGSNKNFHGCLDADAFAYDAERALYYFAGHLDANRKNGVPEKVLVNDLFDVWYCLDFDAAGNCISSDEISVFDAAFSDYFWNIQNDGLRLLQVIFVAVVAV